MPCTGIYWRSQTVRMLRTWKRRGDRGNDVIRQRAWPKLTHFFYIPFNCGTLQSLSCDQGGPRRRTLLKVHLSTLSHPNTIAYLSFTCKALNLCCMPHHFLHAQIKESKLPVSKLRINWVQDFICSEVKIKAERSLTMWKILVGRLRGNDPPERPRHRWENTL
jgi:hypothetical protein